MVRTQIEKVETVRHQDILFWTVCCPSPYRRRAGEIACAKNPGTVFERITANARAVRTGLLCKTI
jgi:hypothetical protein